MIGLNDFYNTGFGWICRHCERELKAEQVVAESEHARFYREGEAETKQPSLSNLALAKWADPARPTLTCPRCGITELVEKA